MPQPRQFCIVLRSAYEDIFALVDHRFQIAGFDKQRLFYTQGDYGLFRCEKPCHNKTYDNYAQVKAMAEEQKDLKIPSALVPRCPVCGGYMTTNLRIDDSFVQDAGWHVACARYKNFIAQIYIYI